MSILSEDMLSKNDLDALLQQEDIFQRYKARKKKWEACFQKWCNESLTTPSIEPFGCCGYGSFCDDCPSVLLRKPCVNALNEYARRKMLLIDYDNTSEEYFERIWNGDEL